MENENHPDMCFGSKFMADINADIECLECKTIYKNKNRVGDFIVNILRKRSVEEAFQSFFEHEIVEEYKCIRCMKSVLATKTFSLFSTPEYLCIILNRLQNRRRKYNKNIEINQEMKVECFAENQVSHWKYGLVSIINHIGTHYNKGHYTTTVNSHNTYTFDDSQVRKQNTISGSEAYILIYERIQVINLSNSSAKYQMLFYNCVANSIKVIN